MFTSQSSVKPFLLEGGSQNPLVEVKTLLIFVPITSKNSASGYPPSHTCSLSRTITVFLSLCNFSRKAGGLAGALELFRGRKQASEVGYQFSIGNIRGNKKHISKLQKLRSIQHISKHGFRVFFALKIQKFYKNKQISKLHDIQYTYKETVEEDSWYVSFAAQCLCGIIARR